MGFMALLFSFLVASIGMYKNLDLNQVSILVGVFIGPAFTAKVVQKFSEK